MNKIKEMVELLGEERKLESKLQEVQSVLQPIIEKVRALNEDIFMSTSLYHFLCEKIMEAFTEDEKERVGEYRKFLQQQQSSTTTAYVNNSTVFDPYNDSWYIFDYEQEGDKIRFKVSCRKNEGSISGLMTFLDTHYTVWIKISELEMFDDGV
jgi:hypothetical protein